MPSRLRIEHFAAPGQSRREERKNEMFQTCFVCFLVVPIIVAPTGQAISAPGSESRGLVPMARTKFGHLSASEETFLRHVSEGRLAKLTAESSREERDFSRIVQFLGWISNRPELARTWTGRRFLNVRCINWVCTDPEASKRVTYRGLEIEGALVFGKLDLRFAKIAFPLSFRNCSFVYNIDLRDAELRAINLDGSLTGRIDAAGLEVKRDLRMGDGFEARGKVDLMVLKSAAT